MLQLRPGCECCDRDLGGDDEAYICSFECTFCPACALGRLGGACPNCGGELLRRPRRTGRNLARHPPSTERVYKPEGCAAAPARAPLAGAALGLVTLVVPDYDEARAFFTGVMRFTVVEDAPRGPGKRWLVVAPPGGHGAALLLAQAASDEQRAAIGRQTGGRVGFFLSSRDFWDDYHHLQSQGVRFLELPREEAYGTVVVFLDRYGNKWDLLQTR